MLVKQKISDHPILQDVERYVNIEGFKVSDLYKKLILDYSVEYIKGEEDVSNLFTKDVPRWQVDNSYKVHVLDVNGEPIPNPDYNPEDEESEEFVMEFAYEYFKQIAFLAEAPIRIEDLMKAYIIRDDINKHRFDF